MHPTMLAADGFSWGTFFTENGLALTLIFILATAIIGALVHVRKKDKCLKFFNGFNVTAVWADGRQIWGQLEVFSKGLELEFSQPHVKGGTTKTSFLIYDAEKTNLVALFRFHDSLSESNRTRRFHQIRRQFHPGLFRRFRRRVRNLFNTLRDAVSKAVGAMIGQAQKMTPSSQVLQTQSKSIGQISDIAVGEIANAYEPILEQYIGRPVVLELADPSRGNERVEYEGFLADYTTDFLCVMSAQQRSATRLTIEQPTQPAFEAKVSVERGEGELRVHNGLDEPLAVQLVGTELEHTVGPNSHIEIEYEPGQAPAKLELSVERIMDLIAPRKLAQIRHGSGARLAQRVGKAGTDAREVTDES